MEQQNILILGSGGREHVFAWKLAQSESKPVLFCAPGNAGTAEVATNVSLAILDFEAVGKFCIDHQIEVVIPCSEDPLVAGIVDHFADCEELKNIFVFGPNQEASRLEGSKDYTKRFLMRHGIPTAQYKTFTPAQINDAKNYLSELKAPYVLKADGLAAGKGVVITKLRAEAEHVLDDMLLGHLFGSAGNQVVIEEFLDGMEFSVFAVSDGSTYTLLPEAKDYKRIGENDHGLNTGGMGAVSPVSFMDQDLMNKVKSTIIEPTFNGLQQDGIPFVGFLFFGLINVAGTPKVIEFNVRMGDPETEVVFPRWEVDLAELINACALKQLLNIKSSVSAKNCVTVFTVSGGYPDAYEKNREIVLKDLPPDSIRFHAGTKKTGVHLLTNGGRVLAHTAFGDTLQEAISNAYGAIKYTQFEGMYYRTDIGQDVLRLTQTQI
ncbi:MAG: phosphoribosylamine--glycine ligase [Bacteroidia bacterium]|jgi:phosphoribosylamine--glycine ligase